MGPMMGVVCTIPHTTIPPYYWTIRHVTPVFTLGLFFPTARGSLCLRFAVSHWAPCNMYHTPSVIIRTWQHHTQSLGMVHCQWYCMVPYQSPYICMYHPQDWEQNREVDSETSNPPQSKRQAAIFVELVCGSAKEQLLLLFTSEALHTERECQLVQHHEERVQRTCMAGLGFAGILRAIRSVSGVNERG